LDDLLTNYKLSDNIFSSSYNNNNSVLNK